MLTSAAGDIVVRLYDCALDPSLWPGVLRTIADELDAAGGSLMLSGPPPVQAMSRIDPCAASLHQHCIAGALMARQRGCPPPRHVYPPHEMVSDGQLLQSDPCDDCFRYFGVFHLLGGFMRRGSVVVGAVSFQRPKSREPFGEEEAKRLSALWPHLDRASQLHARLHADDRACALTDTLDRLPQGVILLDGTGRVTVVNRMAEDILRATDGLAARDGRLVATQPAETQALRRMIDATIAGNCGPDGDAIALPRPSCKRALAVLVSACTANGHGNGTPAARREMHEPGAIVFVTDPERDVRPSIDHLRALWGLNQKEAQLVAGLVAGDELRQTAERLGLTYETARIYLKQVFQKTGSSRQAELVGLVLRGHPRLTHLTS